MKVLAEIKDNSARERIGFCRFGHLGYMSGPTNLAPNLCAHRRRIVVADATTLKIKKATEPSLRPPRSTRNKSTRTSIPTAPIARIAAPYRGAYSLRAVPPTAAAVKCGFNIACYHYGLLYSRLVPPRAGLRYEHVFLCCRAYLCLISFEESRSTSASEYVSRPTPSSGNCPSGGPSFGDSEPY